MGNLSTRTESVSGSSRMANGVLAFVLMTALSKVAVNTWDRIILDSVR